MTITRTDDGIVWDVDPVTGLGKRLTPVPRSRSLTRKPPVMTRQFPPLVDPQSRDWRALLSSLASDPWQAQQLVLLLASDAADHNGAWAVLAKDFPKETERARSRVIDCYLELRRRMT